MNRPVYSADRWIAAWNGVMAFVWTLAVPFNPWALAAVGAHLALMRLPAALARVPAGAPRWLRAAREAYPPVFIGLGWTELGWLHASHARITHDDFVARLDAWLFGFHPHEAWMPAMPQVWFSEIMHATYASYYLFVFGPAVVMLLLGRWGAYREWTFRLLVTYLGCFSFCSFFPVIGPKEFAEPFAGALTGGFFYGLTDGARDMGDSLGTAFPSSHVAGMVTAAWLAFRLLPRRVAFVYAPAALAVALSTVYTGNHYGADALAGALAVPVLQVTIGRAFASGRTGARTVPAIAPGVAGSAVAEGR